MKLIPGSLTKRALMVGLIAGGGILAASSFAMPDGAPVGKEGCEARHGQAFQTKRQAHRTERLAGLKEKLKLAPGQEAAWAAFVGAGQPAMRHEDREAMRGEFAKLNTPQRLDRMQAMAEARRAKMAERAQAIKAFYAQLTPEQQSVFDAEAMPDRHGGPHAHRFQS